MLFTCFNLSYLVQYMGLQKVRISVLTLLEVFNFKSKNLFSWLLFSPAVLSWAPQSPKENSGSGSLDRLGDACVQFLAVNDGLELFRNRLFHLKLKRGH